MYGIFFLAESQIVLVNVGNLIGELYLNCRPTGPHCVTDLGKDGALFVNEILVSSHIGNTISYLKFSVRDSSRTNSVPRIHSALLILPGAGVKTAMIVSVEITCRHNELFVVNVS